MNSFFYFVADCFEAVFNIIPKIADFINVSLFIIGFIGTIYWIHYMITVQNQKDNYLANTNKP